MKRDRLTITLDSELVTAIDGLVDKQTLRNRSHAIEYLLSEGLGLHQLQQAFLFFPSHWQEKQFEAVLELCQKERLSELFICLPTSQSDQQSQIQKILEKTAYHPEISFVPADFGSGGALVLKKEQLQHPFLLFWLGSELQLPDRLVHAYLFHRQHKSLVTEVLQNKELGSYTSAGIFICQPELIASIPPGIVSLQTAVFPEMIKEGRVRGYLFSTGTSN